MVAFARHGFHDFRGTGVEGQGGGITPTDLRVPSARVTVCDTHLPSKYTLACRDGAGQGGGGQ